MKTNLYLIETLSNLHVGSGDINYDVIDRQVQKDPTTQIPIIHSSSLKGAYREAVGEETNYTRFIFGPEPEKSDSHTTGAYTFFDAHLLSRPVRSNVKAYYMATCPTILESLKEDIGNFSAPMESEVKEDLKRLNDLNPSGPIVFDSANNNQNIYIESIESPATITDIKLSESTRQILGSPLVLLPDEMFKKLPLPIIARNRLENGKSENLWYEEVVPKKSRFYFILGKPDHIAEDDQVKAQKFDERFESLEMMQFGANRSIGYGFCRVEKVSS